MLVNILNLGGRHEKKLPDPRDWGGVVNQVVGQTAQHAIPQGALPYTQGQSVPQGFNVVSNGENLFLVPRQ